MKLTPNKTYLGKDGNGNKVRFDEYDFQTVAAFDFFGLIGTFIVSSMFSAIIAPLLSLVVFLNSKNHNQGYYLLAIMLSGFFLLDAYYDWIIFKALGILLEPITYTTLVYINGGVLLLNTYMLSLSLEQNTYYKLYYYTSSDKITWLILLIMFCIVFGFGYYFTGYVFDGDGKWVYERCEYLQKNNL